MTEITFRLIRNCNQNANFDELNDIIDINLNDQNIINIENLELFSHIKELYLANNKINKIENLECFYQLEILDLSNNNIDGNSLLESIPYLPKTLQTINLSGNPCILNEDILIQFQDKFPELGIVIEEILDENQILNDEQYNENTSNIYNDNDHNNSNNSDGEDDNDDGYENKDELNDLTLDFNHNLELTSTTTKSYDRKEYLNSDEVLHQIVERKSKLQSYSKYNIDATVMELNNEFNKSIQSSENINNLRKNRIHCKENHINNTTDDYLKDLECKKQQLLHNHQQDVIQSNTKYNELMNNLKKTSSLYIANIKNSNYDATV